MNNKQPEALRLADELKFAGRYGSETEDQAAKRRLERNAQAAAELRRLHEVNADLIDALQFCAGTSYITDAHEIAEEALKKAEGK